MKGTGLGGITNESIRQGIGTRAFAAAGFAIHGTNSENLLTTAAVPHCINGVFQTAFAIDSEVDVSALTRVSAKDGSTGVAAINYAARASGDDDQTLVFIIACKGNTAYVIEPEVDVAAAQDNANYELVCPAGYCPIGLVKLVRASTDTAIFQFGSNTAANGDLDATGRTATFFDLAGVCPPTVADIVEN